MEFLYKDNDGVIGNVSDVNLLPESLKKLIIKEYDGSHLDLPYAKETIIDANLESIEGILFNCDVLRIYNLGDVLLIRTDSEIIEIAHIDMRRVKYMSNAFTDTYVTKICELDYKNVVISNRLFYATQLKSIPPMRNYEHSDSDIFKYTNIPIHKLRTWSKLMEINKQR